MDKYSGNRGAAKDRGFWLQSFNGGVHAINRIQRGPALIENLSVSMVGGIQPEPMRKLACDSVDDGLLQRLFPILLVAATLGRDECKPDAVAHYERLVEALVNIKLPTSVFNSSVSVLRFDDAAQEVRRRLERRHLQLMAAECINRKLAAHLGKYDGLFARLCIIWHCVEHASVGRLPGLISEDVAGRVAKFLHGFLLQHAAAFYAGTLGLSDDHDRLTAVAGYILAHGLQVVTSRDVQRGDRTMRGIDRPNIQRIFEQLEALGWLQQTPGKRPTDPPHWRVNSAVHARFAARAELEFKRRQMAKAMMAELFGRRGNECHHCPLRAWNRNQLLSPFSKWTLFFCLARARDNGDSSPTGGSAFPVSGRLWAVVRFRPGREQARCWWTALDDGSAGPILCIAPGMSDGVASCRSDTLCG